MIDTLLSDLLPLAPSWRPFASGFSRSEVPRSLFALLPNSDLAAVRSIGAREGFIGSRYVRLYALDELAAANEAYGVDTWLPGFWLIGSDGCGTAFLCDLKSAPVHVVECPFIPLDSDYFDRVHDNFELFLSTLVQAARASARAPIQPNPDTLGLEIHEKHPVVLGGDPTAPDNKMLLRPPERAKACTFFNRIFREVRAGSS